MPQREPCLFWARTGGLQDGGGLKQKMVGSLADLVDQSLKMKTVILTTTFTLCKSLGEGWEKWGSGGRNLACSGAGYWLNCNACFFWDEYIYPKIYCILEHTRNGLWCSPLCLEPLTKPMCCQHCRWTEVNSVEARKAVPLLHSMYRCRLAWRWDGTLSEGSLILRRKAGYVAHTVLSSERMIAGRWGSC